MPIPTVLTGERVKIFFLRTQIRNWSTIHTVTYGMLASTSGTMTIAMMSPWLATQFLFLPLLLMLRPLLTLSSMTWGLQNKQSMRHSAETVFANSTPRCLLNGSRNSRFCILRIPIPSSTSPRIPSTYWVTWYSIMVSSPHFPCNQVPQ